MSETDERWWLVVGPHYWGRGATREDAIKEVKKAGLRTLKKMMVFRGPKEMYVNEWGDIVHPSETTVEKVEERGVLQKVKR